MDEEMNERGVVADYFIGHTRIKIHDDYCRGKTDDEIEETMKRIANIVNRSYKNDDTAGKNL